MYAPASLRWYFSRPVHAQNFDCAAALKRHRAVAAAHGDDLRARPLEARAGAHHSEVGRDLERRWLRPMEVEGDPIGEGDHHAVRDGDLAHRSDLKMRATVPQRV